MRVLSEAVVVVACFSAAFSVAWYISNRRLKVETRKACFLLLTCFLACGLSRLVDVAEIRYPDLPALDYIEAFFVSVALVCGVSIWPLLPDIARLPSTADLQDANQDLERRVAARSRELLEANRRFEAALSGSNITVSEQDSNLRYVWAHNLPNATAPERVVGGLPSDWLPPDVASRLVQVKKAVLSSGRAAQFDLSVDFDGDVRWFEERVEPVEKDGAIIGVISTAVDVTARKRHELELIELLRELTHRSKNLLAVVQGIARQTGQTTASLAEFNMRFAGRLQALSLVHEMLVTSSWRGLGLHPLIEGVIRTIAPHRLSAVEIIGPPVELGAELAQSLALALNEMAFKAASEGALSQPAGTLHIDWSSTSDADGRRTLLFRWCERGGGDSLHASGLGGSFIQTLLQRAIDGTSVVTIDGDSLVWSLTFPWPSSPANEQNARLSA